MLFNSWQFLVFFPVVTLGYFLLSYKWRNWWLLAASILFYMAFIPQYVVILFALIVIDYVAGIKISSSKGSKRRFFLLLSIGANLTILGVFKYFNFFNANISAVAGFLGLNYPIPLVNIVLAIGLSFHTFQAMSYTIEVYWRRQKPEKNFLVYALYVMFYPQLVAGPIERPQNLLHQFKERHGFDYENFTSGLRQMLWGMFKKVVIADRLAVYVNQVYGWPYDYVGLTLIVATIFFAFQIYCDFSGYSDIAIGAARVMGFRLMKNFDNPYSAKSISDFWSRWHISLSSWFRDYVYIPLGGNRVSKITWLRNITVVFGLSGLWHGANWTFLIWGLLHGLYYLLFSLVNSLGERFRKVFEVISPILTFALVCFAWIFFRANDLHQAFYIVSHLLVGIGGYFQYVIEYLPKYLAGTGTNDQTYLLFLHLNYQATELEILFAVALIGLLIVADNGRRWFGSQWSLEDKPLVVRWFVYILTTLAILNYGTITQIPFIYFQF